jgi:hypothetical protein
MSSVASESRYESLSDVWNDLVADAQVCLQDTDPQVGIVIGSKVVDHINNTYRGDDDTLTELRHRGLHLVFHELADVLEPPEIQTDIARECGRILFDTWRKDGGRTNKVEQRHEAPLKDLSPRNRTPLLRKATHEALDRLTPAERLVCNGLTLVHLHRYFEMKLGDMEMKPPYHWGQAYRRDLLDGHWMATDITKNFFNAAKLAARPDGTIVQPESDPQLVIPHAKRLLEASIIAANLMIHDPTF